MRKVEEKANKRRSPVPSHFHHFLALETIAELRARASWMFSSVLGAFLAQMQMGEKET